MYEFIKNYLFIPLGGSRVSFRKHLLSMLLSFSFIFYWHGLTVDILVWSMFNFLMILFEIYIYQKVKKKQQIHKILYNTKFRLICVSISKIKLLNRFPISIFITLSQLALFINTLLFLDGFHVLNQLINRSMSGNVHLSILLILFGFYSNSQIRLEVKKLIA